MKNINTRKVVAGVAALGLSALLAGSVVAANVGNDNFSMNITKDTMYNNGVPSVSVVVGSMAQPVDVVWAGNIAAAIGKKAYVSTGVAGGAALQDVTIEVGSKGSTTISGDGRLYNDTEMGTSLSWTNTLRNSHMPILFDGDVEYYDYSDTKKTLRNVKESVKVDIDDVYFEKDKDTKAVIAKIPARGITYTLDLGSTGIEVEDSSNDDVLTVGGDHDIEIPFLGQMYKIRSLVSDKLTLVSNQDKMTYMQGSEFAVENYTVKVSTITSGTPNRVLLELSQNGSVVKSESVRDGKSTTFGGLVSEITVTQVNYASDQLGYIEVSKGSGVLELEKGEEVDTFTDDLGREWEVNWTVTSRFLKSVTLQNVDGWNGIGDSDFPALKIGDTALLPNDLGAVNFVGLKDETMYPFEVSNKRIKFSDKSYSYEVPLYVDKSYTSGSETSMKFTVDNKDYYLIRKSDGTYVISSTNKVDDVIKGYIWTENGASVDSYKLTDPTVNLGPITLAANKAFIAIPSDLTSSTLHYFAILEDTSATKMAISLSSKLVSGTEINGSWDTDLSAANFGSKVGTLDWKLMGTDNDSDTAYDVFYYDALSVDTKGEGLAQFVITDHGAKNVVFLMDTYYHRLADRDDFESAEYTITNKVNYNTTTFTLDDKESDDLRKGVTLSGAEVEISSKNFIASFPEVAKKFEVFVGGEATATTSLNGGTLVLSTPGATVSTEDGKVSAKLVSANVSGSESMTAMTPANWNVNNSRLVYLDNESMTGAGAKIIVGGHLVNSLASGITDEYLTEAGQFVVGATATGDVVVAGFSAADTADAAKALISVIEALE